MSSGVSAEVRVCGGPEEVGRAAAETVLAGARAAIAERGAFRLALSGGSTPKVLYRLLGSKPYRSAVVWPKVHVFWVDERCVAPDHEDSNYRIAYEAFLSRAAVPPGQIHRIRGEEGPEAAAVAYELELRDQFGGTTPGFDVVILGVGEDGHTASLFPGGMDHHPERLAVPVFRTSGHSRVTLTLGVLNRSRQAVFLATGAEKARIVATILDAGAATDLPAALIRPAGGLLWLLDREAAVKLKRFA